MKHLILSLAIIGSSAYATTNTKDAKKAEAAMMTACQKEYPTQVKGKKFKEVADWVETEERGANKEKFKTSKCFNLHEDWEKVAEYKETGEE